MSEPPASRWGLRRRAQRIRALVRSAAPFASGVLAALVALLLYNNVVPKPHQLTPREVDDAIAQALGSATPPPAFSANVYQVIRPSLVLIQSRHEDSNTRTENGLGTGVVVSDRGDILTSLHVVANAQSIVLTFADGTRA